MDDIADRGRNDSLQDLPVLDLQVQHAAGVEAAECSHDIRNGNRSRFRSRPLFFTLNLQWQHFDICGEDMPGLIEFNEYVCRDEPVMAWDIEGDLSHEDRDRIRIEECAIIEQTVDILYVLSPCL